MLKKCILPVSLKEPSQSIYNLTDFLNFFGTKKVYLVHILPGAKQKKPRKLVDKISERADKISQLNFQTEMYFRNGPVATEVTKLSEELEADFISLLWGRKGFVKRTLLGSVDNDILRLSDLPVFVYKTRLYLEKKTSLNRVLYATDFKVTDSSAIPYLIYKEFQADTLFLLHVGERAPDPYTEKVRRENIEQNLQRLAKECNQAFKNIETLEVVGLTKSQIVRQAWKHKVDLIVIGKFDKENPFEKIIGSTAEAIPHKSSCHVLFVPRIRKMK